MKERPSPSEWSREFREFLTCSEKIPLSSLTEQINLCVKSDLNPPKWKIFSKLVFIHAIVGSITLLFCPQFGVSPFKQMGLMTLFMQFGEFGCMFGCGAFYLGVSAFVAGLMLKNEELKVLRQNEIFQIPILTFLSVAGFFCLGSAIVFQVFLAAWALGSILGGISGIELCSLIRRKRILA